MHAGAALAGGDGGRSTEERGTGDSVLGRIEARMGAAAYAGSPSAMPWMPPWSRARSAAQSGPGLPGHRARPFTGASRHTVLHDCIEADAATWSAALWPGTDVSCVSSTTPILAGTAFRGGPCANRIRMTPRT